MRLPGRFLFLHTQKHTQEYLLDFNVNLRLILGQDSAQINRKSVDSFATSRRHFECGLYWQQGQVL